MRCWRSCGRKVPRWIRSGYTVSAAAQQLKGFIEENRQQLRPALDKLNGVLTIIDNRKQRLQLAVKGLNTYAMSLGESVSSGPFFKAYVVNCCPDNSSNRSSTPHFQIWDWTRPHCRRPS